MSDELPAVRAGYDRWSAVYDRDLNPLQGLEGPVVRSLVGEVRGLCVLDLGCGTGRHALWLAENGATVTGVDFSAGMLAEARRKPGSEAVRWIECDLTTPLPFAGEFDLVVSVLVLEHVADLDGFFWQIGNALKHGGRAVVSGMHPAMVLRGAEARFTDPDTGEVVSPGSLAHSVGAFVMAATRAGFDLTEVVERAPDARVRCALSEGGTVRRLADGGGAGDAARNRLLKGQRSDETVPLRRAARHPRSNCAGTRRDADSLCGRDASVGARLPAGSYRRHGHRYLHRRWGGVASDRGPAFGTRRLCGR